MASGGWRVARGDRFIEPRTNDSLAPVTPHSPRATPAILRGLIATFAVPVAGTLQIGLEVVAGSGGGAGGFRGGLGVGHVRRAAEGDGQPR